MKICRLEGSSKYFLKRVLHAGSSETPSMRPKKSIRVKFGHSNQLETLQVEPATKKKPRLVQKALQVRQIILPPDYWAHINAHVSTSSAKRKWSAYEASVRSRISRTATVPIRYRALATALSSGFAGIRKFEVKIRVTSNALNRDRRGCWFPAIKEIGIDSRNSHTSILY